MSRMPSVITLIRVEGVVVSSRHLVSDQAALVLDLSFDEVADREGSDPSRLGHPMIRSSKPCLMEDQGICVVFPLPVGLSTMMT